MPNITAIKKTIEELEGVLRTQEEQALATKKTLNFLYQQIGEKPRYEEAIEERKTTIKRDEYFNQPLATAVRMYLEKRGEAATVTEIVEALKNGGFDFGNVKFADKNMRISLAKNTALFAYIKGNDSFGLRKQYGLKIKEKLGKNGGKTSKKGKRGRPPKIKGTQKSEEQPKKKRGRPPKKIEVLPEPVEVENKENLEELLKKVN